MPEDHELASPNDNVQPVLVPQVNVNDDEVRLVGWRVEAGACVRAGQVICEVETSKSVEEIPAPADGMFVPAVDEGRMLAVGALLGYIGPSREAVEAFLKASCADRPADAPAADTPRATLGAVQLAREHGIDVAMVPATGDRIRREDVERFLAATAGAAIGDPGALPGREQEALPPLLAPLVTEQPPLGDHAWSVARHLAATQARLTTTQVAADVRMDRVVAWMESRRQSGRVAGVPAAMIHAAAAAVAADARLASFRLGRRVFRYQAVDIAFTARSAEGRLFAPVVRGADRRSPDDVADEVARLSMAVFRGELTGADQAGACMTVSVLADRPVRWHVGLQNAFQSAILSCGAVREELVLLEGQARAVPTATLVLSYDHGLMDGWEASGCLDAARQALENLAG